MRVPMSVRRRTCEGGPPQYVVLSLLLAGLALLLATPPASAAPITVFADDFEAGLSDWNVAGTVDWYSGTPKHDTHSVRLAKKSSITQTVPTTSYSDLSLSFYLGAENLGRSDTVSVEWSNGSYWHLLTQIGNRDPENDGELHFFEFALPTDAYDNPSFALRFSISANKTSDLAFVDDVVLTGEPAQYTLSLSGSGGQVLVDGSPQTLPWSGDFAMGTVVSLEAVPAAGWQFSNWSGALSGSTNPTTITMDSAKSVGATFSQIFYTLNLTGSGSGQVRVNGTLRALPWSGSFAALSAVSLEAVPAAGWQFDNWSGDLSGSTNPTTITMDAAKSVGAAFSQIFYALNLTGSGSGQVKVNGTLRSLPWSGTFAALSVVSLEAVPAAGWQFDNWSGALSGSTNPTTITMDSAKSIGATFSQILYALNLTGSGSGQVRVNGTLRSLPWSGTFAALSVVSLEAVPQTGWQFDGWSGNLSGTTNPTTITMDSAKSVGATFSQIFYTLNLDATGSGSVKVNGVSHALPWASSFASGSVVRLEAIPDADWEFTGWSGDVDESSPVFFVTMAADTDITAGFSEYPILTITGSGSGAVRVNWVTRSLPWSQGFPTGSSVVLEAVPAAGWRFDKWSKDVKSEVAVVTVEIDGDMQVQANFAPLPTYDLTVTKSGSGSVIVDGVTRSLPWSGTYLEGTEVTLEAVPADGWEFSEWSGDATGYDPSITITMDGDRDVAAAFQERTTFWLTMQLVGDGLVSVDGSYITMPWVKLYDKSAEVELKAFAKAGWQFDGWSGAVAGHDSPLVITIDHDMTVTANFSRVQHTLTMEVVGSGAITVNGSEVTVPYTGEFEEGSSLVVKAVPDGGWLFEAWSGSVESTAATITVVMSEDKTLWATFVEPETYRLSLSKTGSGTVKVDGATVQLPWSADLPRDTTVELEVVLAGAQEFLEWSGDLSGEEMLATVVMDGDKSIVANFTCIAVFPDVPCDYWCVDEVQLVYDFGIAYGYPDGLYRPRRKVDRGAMAVYIARALSGSAVPPGPEEATFSDVPPDHWTYDAVEYIAALDIVQGYGDGTYQPNWFVNRAQMAVFVARALVISLGEGEDPYVPPETPSFDDIPTDYWAYAEVEYLVENGVVSGYPDGRYRPTNVVTRGEMAVYIARAFILPL